MNNIPQEPDDRCRCVVPEVHKGLANNGWGMQWCGVTFGCGKFIKWGVGNFSLLTGRKDAIS